MTRVEALIADLGERLDRPRTFWTAAGVLATAFVALSYLTRLPAITTGADDATYMLLAESLRQGTYRDLLVLGQPFHTTWPPLFPAWIMMLSLVGIASVDGVILVNCLLVGATLLLVAEVVRRKWSAGAALTVLAVSAVNPQVLFWTGMALSEASYLALSVLALWGATKKGWQGTVVAGGAAVAAIMTRSIGVALLASIVLVWMLDGRWKRAFVWGAIGGVVLGAWFMWTNVAPSPNTYSVILSTGSEGAGGGWLPALWDSISQNVGRYLPLSLFEALHYPTIEGTLADNLAWLLFTIVAGVSGIISVWRKWPTLAGYLVAYFMILWVWPWQSSRFFMPALPLVQVVLIVGLLDLARRLRRPAWGPVGVALLVALLLGSSLAEVETTVAEARACDRQSPYDERSCFKPSDRAFLTAANYAGTSLPRDAVVGSLRSGALAWYANIRVAPYWMFMPGGDGAVPDALRNGDVQYVLLAQISPGDWRIVRSLQVLCDRFEVVESFPHHTMLLRFAHESLAEGADACRAMKDYERTPLPD